MVMGTVALIEERGNMNLGLGVPAGEEHRHIRTHAATLSHFIARENVSHALTSRYRNSIVSSRLFKLTLLKKKEIELHFLHFSLKYLRLVKIAVLHYI